MLLKAESALPYLCFPSPDLLCICFLPTNIPEEQRSSQQLASPNLTVAKLGAVRVHGTAGEGREARPERKGKACTVWKTQKLSETNEMSNLS